MSYTLRRMSHYGQSASYAVPPAPYPGHPPPPGLEIPPPPHHPHPPTVQPAYHPYASTHHYAANNAAYPALPLGHQYPPGYAPPPPAYASPPSAPPALYPDGRLAHYPASAVPPPPMSPYPPNPTPVVVYANGQPSPVPPLHPPQQGYYSSMLNSPLPSPHSITSPTRPHTLPNQTSPIIRPSPIPSPQTNGLKSPVSVITSKSPVASSKSPGSFLPPKSPGHNKSPSHAPPSPSMKSPDKPSQKSPEKTPTSQANGPLRSLEKMICHEKTSDRVSSDGADCKIDILAEANPARSDSCRRRSSSHSGDDIKPGSRSELESRSETTTAVPTADPKKKRGRPTGSRSRKRAADEEDQMPKRKRAKKVDAKTALAIKNNQADKSDKHDKLLGPRIRIEGLRANPKMCTVINNLSHSDEKDKKRGPEIKERVNRVTENVKLTDAPWVCCFCGWGSTHAQLGDLFGPYHIEGFRPPRRESPKRRKRGDSRCSDDGDRLRRSSGESTGEVWLHEECATWAEGVYMVGYRMQGLEEAARMARQTQCSACKVDGATIGCLHKGCQQKYHYPCAIGKDCLLNEENFSLVCYKHKCIDFSLSDHRINQEFVTSKSAINKLKWRYIICIRKSNRVYCMLRELRNAIRQFGKP